MHLNWKVCQRSLRDVSVSDALLIAFLNIFASQTEFCCIKHDVIKLNVEQGKIQFLPGAIKLAPAVV